MSEERERYPDPGTEERREKEGAPLAGEGEQMLAVATGAADPGETADRPPAVLVGGDGPAHHVAQGAAAGFVAIRVRALIVLPEALQQAVEGGALGVARAVERGRRLRASGRRRARPHIPSPRGTGGWSRRAGPPGLSPPGR